MLTRTAAVIPENQSEEPLPGRRRRASWERRSADPWEEAALGTAGSAGWFQQGTPHEADTHEKMDADADADADDGDDSPVARNNSRALRQSRAPRKSRSSMRESEVMNSTFTVSTVSTSPSFDSDGFQSNEKKRIDGGAIYDRVFNIIYKTNVGFYFDLWQAMCSLLACAAYIWSTYQTDKTVIPTWLFYFECIVTSFFALDYLLRMYLAPSRAQYMLTPAACIDVASMLPVLTLFISNGANLGVIRLLRGARVLRILRINRLFTITQDRTSPVNQQIMLVCFKIIAFMFICAGTLHTIDDVADNKAFKNNNTNDEFHYFDALYFVIISVSTVGYGDINPTMTMSKLISMGMIIALMAIVPRELSKLTSLMDRTSVYDAGFTPKAEAGHVLVCGKPSYPSVSMFLREFYHADHGEQRTRVVILHPDEPSELVKEVIEEQVYIQYVQYVKGNVMNVDDLRKVLAFEASAVFILSDQFTDNRDSSDLDCILASKAVGSLVDVERQDNPIPTYIQLLKASSTDHCNWASSSDSKHAITQNICIETLKMGLLAASVRCPGFLTLLSNMVVSTGEFENVHSEWLQHYTTGYGQEIYANIGLSPHFLGWTFAEMAAEAFKKFGVCVFAITIPEVEDADQGKETFINPADYVLLGVETCCLIADDINEARSITHHVPSKRRPVAKSLCPTRPPSAIQRKRETVLPHPIDPSKLVDHVILCGKITGLQSFVEPLRKVTNQPIVVLHPEDLDKEDQNTVLDFDNVCHLKGNPLLLQDLRAAGADSCETVVIFGDYTGHFFKPSGGHTTDTFAVFVAESVDANFDCRWVVELMDGSSMRFLNDRPKNLQDAFTLFPRYCAGYVYLANIFDSLMAQAFYNDSLIEIICTLINGGDMDEKDKGVGSAPPSYIVRSTAKNAEVAEVIVSPVERTMFRTVDVPVAYAGRPYCDFFLDLMLNHKCLPLGLFCGKSQPDNPLEYVFCNPQQKMILHGDDKVYVLSGDEPLHL